MTQGFEDNFVNKIICGDARMVMQQLPKAVFNCAITSPPYWGLRAYQTTPVVWADGWRGELGLEPTPEFYIDHLMTVFDGVKRVLRKDGILFVNIGDTYGGEGTQRSSGGRAGFAMDIDEGKRIKKGTQAKSLCAIPERFVLAMMAHGWIRRCTIIWAKGLSFCDTYSGSCMPDSCKDRPNKNGFEYVYMFTKSKKYFYEQVFEEAQELNAERPRMGQGNQTKYHSKRGYGGGGSSLIGHSGTLNTDGSQIGNPLGRTIRNVWTINPQPFSEAHFATFPEKLVEICLKLGCPEFVCKKCGLPRKKIYEKGDLQLDSSGGKWTKHSKEIEQRFIKDRAWNAEKGFAPNLRYEQTEIGLTDCGCGAGFRAGITFDPFMGSGTVALGAYKNRRDYCGIELSEEYVRMAETRLDEARQQYSLLEPNKEA